jgi:hypothetical protein
MKLISKQSYLNNKYKNQPFFWNILKKIKNLKLVGKYIRIYFLWQKMPFYFACAARDNYYSLRIFVKHVNVQRGVCVGQRWQGLASSIRVRFVNTKVLFERHFFINSPRIFAIKPVKTSGVNRLIINQAKLYYFNTKLIGKHLNIYYFS